MLVQTPEGHTPGKAHSSRSAADGQASHPGGLGGLPSPDREIPPTSGLPL